MNDPKHPDYMAPMRDFRLYGHLVKCFGDYGFDKEGHFFVQQQGTLFFEAVHYHVNWFEEHHGVARLDGMLDGERVKKHQEILDACLTYGMFNAAGRNIFAIKPKLVEQFGHTDVDEVCLHDMAMPYPGFYISFGPQANLALPEGGLVDGAYITRMPYKGQECMKITLSSHNPKFSYDSPLDPVHEMPPPLTFFLPLVPGENMKTLMTRMLAGERLDDHKRIPNEGDVNGFIADSQKRIEQAYIDNLPVLAKAINLTVNSICFISTFPEMIRKDEGLTPQQTAVMNKEPQNRKERRAREHIMRSMEENGYSNLHFCNDTATDGKDDAEPGKTGREVDTHWRRGHWRRQPYGPGLTSIRMKLIRPTLVRRDKGGPEYGHIYDVSPDIPSVPSTKDLSQPSQSPAGGLTHGH